ncbi:MAG: hypothetical protein R3C24_10150 [Cyanobacteriota/Melainabacteria group bacterium]
MPYMLSMYVVRPGWKPGAGSGRIDFASCLEDVRRTLKVIKRAHRALPVFILGESMGGIAIALRTAMYLIWSTAYFFGAGER